MTYEPSPDREAVLLPIWQALIQEAEQFENYLVNHGTHAMHKEMVALAERASLAVAPHTPCKRGCSACCFQAVSISQFEADDIERFTGRSQVPQRAPDMHDPAGEAYRLLRKISVDRARYFRVPCSFLEHGECSIYDVRPVACRLHHSIAEDAKPCSGARNDSVPKLDFRLIEGLHAEATLFTATADIREFFPRQT